MDYTVEKNDCTLLPKEIADKANGMLMCHLL